MIQDLMRKHKRGLLYVIVGLIIIPFVFWGGYTGFTGGQDPEMDPMFQEPIAVVGGMPIDSRIFMAALNEQLQQRRMMDPDVSYKDLHEDETAMQVIEMLVDQMVVDLQSSDVDLRFDRDFLVEQLRNHPRFQRDGEFDPELWNMWVQDGERTRNWNVEYENIENNLQRRLVLERALAPARVLERDVRRQFERDNTPIRVRYVLVEPEVELTEDEIEQFYAENASRYEIPEQYHVDFATISLEPPMPDLVNELVERARDGEDFAELAQTYSDAADAEDGGEMDWQMPGLTVPDHVQPLFDLEVGDVSDPVKGPNGYYIYKAEEERFSELSGDRDVRGRRIVIRPELSDEARLERMAQAELLVESAGELDDFVAAAEKLDLPVHSSGAFNRQSSTIRNVPSTDVWGFRNAMLELDEGDVSSVVEGSRNLYVAHVKEVEPSELPPLNDVRDDVIQDAKQAARRTPEYRLEVAELAQEMLDSADSIQELIDRFPEYNLVPEETPAFSVAEFRPAQNMPMWPPDAVVEAVWDKQPGKLAGPVRDYMGQLYFVELVEKETPDDEIWDEFEEQKDMIRDRLIARAQNERFDDFRAESRARLNWQLNPQAYGNVIGLEDEEEAVEPDDLFDDEGIEAVDAPVSPMPMGQSGQPPVMPMGDGADIPVQLPPGAAE